MDTTQLAWMIPVTLLLIAVLQILYLVWLMYWPTGRKTTGQQGSPVMPTMPESDFATPPSPYNSVPPGVSSIGKLVILSGVSNLTEVPLPVGSFGIGRFYNEEGNILVALDERSVSRRHATFVSDESTREYYMTDTNSSYGTRIRIGNQFEPVTPGSGERIYNEDVVQFGNVVTVRFILPCDTRPAGSRPSF